MSGIRVLIVEDDPMVAEINKKFTEGIEGFLVAGMVRNGQDAIEFLLHKPVDLLILDIYLREKSGLEVLAEVRRQELPVDVIAVTAADDSKTVSRILRQGVFAYIAKPFKFERYRSVLETYRGFHHKLELQNSLAQEDIDGILAAHRPCPRDMPKNFNHQTLELIINHLIEHTQFRSAEEIAAGVGLSRVTVRRYLEYLVEQGRVVRNLDYLGIGRPIHRFRIGGRRQEDG